ncbi:MAG: hypothetical protein AAB695_00825, partial [Patescibacteria group bacterium]
KLFIKEIPDFAPEALRRAMPELPWDKRRCLLKLGISPEHAEIYVTEPEWGSYFEEVAEILKDAKLITLASNYITSELEVRVSAIELAEVVRMIEAGEISSRGAKEILKILQSEGGEAREIAEKNNLLQISDREVLRKFVTDVIKDNPKAPIQFLVGQVMKKTSNRANPEVAKELLLKVLDS